MLLCVVFMLHLPGLVKILTTLYRNVTLTEIISFLNKINRYITKFNILRINIKLKKDKNKPIYRPINLIVILFSVRVNVSVE
jgi:hypothetical protein